jgi:acyl-coenzyme A thioesterase PaaI-like protein
LKKQLQQLLDRARFLRAYGFRVVSVSKAKCTLELPHRSALERPGGIINGPALMAAADCAMWLAIKARLGLDKDARHGRARVLHRAHTEGGPAAHLRRRRMPRQKG